MTPGQEWLTTSLLPRHEWLPPGMAFLRGTDALATVGMVRAGKKAPVEVLRLQMISEASESELAIVESYLRHGIYLDGMESLHVLLAKHMQMVLHTLFHQKSMRHHLVQCFQQQQLQPFEIPCSKKKNRLKHIQIHLYCTCGLSQSSDSQTIQCDICQQCMVPFQVHKH